MTPSIAAVRMSGAKHRAELPLLVLGPASGVSASELWADCAAHLADAFDMLAWDLPGLGHSAGVPLETFTIAELAAGVLDVVDDVLAARGEASGSFAYAGDWAGVGRKLQRDAPGRVRPGRLVELDRCAADPATSPERVARLIRHQLLGDEPADEVLGGRANGLDERARSLICLTALVVQGRHGELASALQTARDHGITGEEFEGLLRQLADHTSDRETARRIAQAVFGS